MTPRLNPFRPTAKAALSGALLVALGVVGSWGAPPAGLTNPLKPLRTPGATALDPVDQQAFTQRYGDEALFRLKLGIDAGERQAPTGAAKVNCAAGWESSDAEKRYQAALNRKQWYAAGETLGTWRRHCGLAGGEQGARP